MTLTADNVRVAVTGAALVAPLATTLPTNATTAPGAAFDDTGYIHEDGVTQSIGSESSDIKAWQNGDVVRKVQTSHDLTYQFTMIETNVTTLKVYYNDPDATASQVKITGRQSGRNSWVLEIEDDDHLMRIVLPDAQVGERGDVVYKTDEAIGYNVTLTAYPDEDGVKAYIYMDDNEPAGE